MDFLDYAVCYNCKSFNRIKDYCKERDTETTSLKHCSVFDKRDKVIHKNEIEVKKPPKTLQIQVGMLPITNYMQNVEAFHEIQPFFYDRSKIFWLWNKEQFMWEIIDEVDVMNAIEKQLNFGGQTVTSAIKGNYLEAFKRVGRKNIPKATPKTTVQFKNKIINIKTGEEKEASPEYFCCNPIPHEIGESESTPIIDKIFTEWIGEEKKQLLYEIIAYCMLQDYPLARIFSLVGSGSNGKTCYLNLLQNTIGQENCSSSELDRLIDRFGTTTIYKKLVCLMGETNFGQLKKTSMLKRLSGNDMIDFEFKGKNIFSDYNYAKLLIATNTLPTTLDKTDGFYRRWIVIKFPNKFSEKTDILASIPQEEYNNLCTKSVRILKNIIKDRCLSCEGTIEERKNEFEKYSNPLMNFIQEECVIDVNAETPVFEFYDNFIVYLNVRGFREMSKVEVGRQVVAEGFESIRKWVKNDAGEEKQWRHYTGIRLKELVEKQSTLPVTPVTGVSIFSTQSPYIGNELEMPAQASQVSQTKQEWDERARAWIPCFKCGNIPTNEAPDKHFYCEDCLKLYKDV